LKGVAESLRKINALTKDVLMSRIQFMNIVAEDIAFLYRIFEGSLKIPDFEHFVQKLHMVFEKVAKVNDGKTASYIPELAKVDPESFALSVCTVDGQRWSFGKCDEPFSIQSGMKPICYLMALEEHGEEKVHRHVDIEPSGKRYNMLVLKDVGWTVPNQNGYRKKIKIPHNPMINAGALVTCSLIMSGAKMADRFNKVMKTWGKLCGSKIGYGNSVYLSEKANANRNWCLGFMMQEYSSFPDDVNLKDTMDFYFQCCSMEVNCKQLAQLAATIANGGTSVMTEERIFDPKHVRHCLSIMLTSGMNMYSGE